MNLQTVLLCGGGSGGHITPTLHVARALKQSDPSLRIVYVVEKGTAYADLVEECDEISKVYYISAGKYRRYHGRSKLAQLLDIKTNVLNIRDLFRTAAGYFQSKKLLRKEKPSVIFVKGGFVGVPIGYAAKAKKVPLITHDSDSVPGLANRIISRWAVQRLVVNEQAAAAYKNERTVIVGVPVDERFKPVTEEEQLQIRKELGLSPSACQLLITGGSLGAQRMNAAVREMLLRITSEIPELQVTWIVGAGNIGSEEQWLSRQSDEVKQKVQIRSFINNMYQWILASDVIISRAGATAVAEIIAAAKPAIIVPATFLAANHQMGNAELLLKAGAAALVHELDDIMQYGGDLAYEATRLLTDPAERAAMSESSQTLSKGNVARNVAEIILGARKK